MLLNTSGDRNNPSSLVGVVGAQKRGEPRFWRNDHYAFIRYPRQEHMGSNKSAARVCRTLPDNWRTYD
jgi:hypothetical protein